MNTWIFQGNPDRFKVDEYLKDNENIEWSIRQEHFVDLVNLGDIVYIWRSNGKQGNGGIVARAKVTGKPILKKDATSKYWVNPSDANEVLPRVPMKVQEKKLSGDHISRNFLLKNEVLSDLLILKMSNNTNYLLDDKHILELSYIWQSSDGA